MKHIHTFENFLNEAKAIKVELTSDSFSINSTWGIYKNAKMTGLSTQQTAVNVEPISSNNQANASANNQTFFWTKHATQKRQ